MLKSEETPAAPSSSGDPLRGLAHLVVTQPENREAARTLLRAVSPSLLRVVRGILGAQHPDVPDVCQESAVALLAALADFRGHSSLTHFACRIAVFTAMNARRRARFSCRSVTTDDVEPSDGAPGPAEDADAAKRRAALRRLLDELPPAQAEVLALHVMLGYTVQETAATLGAPLDTVRSRLRRALAALRERIHRDSALLEVVGGRT